MANEKIIPEQIDVQITGRCNARCGMCIQEITYKSLDLGEFAFREGTKKHLSEFYELGGRKIIITGGEPTLFPSRVEDVLNISNFLGKWDLVAMYTNGSQLMKKDNRDVRAELDSHRHGMCNLSKRQELIKKLDKTVAQRCKDSGLQYVDLSVHHYDSVRNGLIFGLSHLDAQEISAHLQQVGLPFRYCATIQKGGIENINDVFQYLDFARQNGAKDVYFRELFRVDRSKVENPERVGYIDKNFVSLDTILQSLENRKFFPIGKREDFQGRDKIEFEFRTNDDFPFYFSRLKIGGEIKEELPYLVVMPNGQLHSTWHGKGDYIESLKDYCRSQKVLHHE